MYGRYVTFSIFWDEVNLSSVERNEGVLIGKGRLFLIRPNEIKRCWIPNTDAISGERRKELIPQSSWVVWTLPFDKLSWGALPALNQYTSTLPHHSGSLDSLPQWCEAASIPLPSHAALWGGPFSLKSTEDSSKIENTLELFEMGERPQKFSFCLENKYLSLKPHKLMTA